MRRYGCAMRDSPRYDGVADWYDATIREGPASRVTTEAERLLVQLLGPGTGRARTRVRRCGPADPARRPRSARLALQLSRDLAAQELDELLP
jgi:hypothetical protein